MSREQLDKLEMVLRTRPFDRSQSIEAQRRSFDSFAVRPVPQDVTMRDVELGGISAIELTVAGNDAEPAVLYFHGGGYVVGSARTGAHLAAELARRTGGRALSVDYRLAPEHPYPAAVEDGVAAYAGLLDTGMPSGRVLVAGDSAGGGLAIAVLLAARDKGLAQPAAAAAFSPWTDMTRTGASMRTKVNADPLFSYEAMGWYASRYVPSGDPSAPLASPAFASLAGLPPLLLQAGSHEVLMDDAVRLAAAAATADVDVTLQVTAGAAHVFQNSFGGIVDEADQALDDVARFALRRFR